MNDSEIQTVSCRTAVELLEQLSPRGPIFGKDGAESWAFRGHEDASWDLTPSAFRPNSKLAPKIFRKGLVWEKWTNADQIQSEATTILSFLKEADGAGLPIPRESHELREQLQFPFKIEYERHFDLGEVEWPPRRAWPVVALAQHYGLATRFLDWTYSPYVACYFAAIGALTSETAAEHLAVWAFSVSKRYACWGLLSPFGQLPDRFPEEVIAPYAGNPNLRAQEGLHIAVTTGTLKWRELAARLDFIPYLQYVDRFSQRTGKALLKFTLQSFEADALLWHLAKERITAARLFPGYGGAAQSVLERHLYRDR